MEEPISSVNNEKVTII